MPLQKPRTAGALCATLALAAATMFAQGAHATDVISFIPGNPWTQNVGSISKASNFHEYTVSAEPGKTLKINLISHNPNLYFRVIADGSRKPLLDTADSGETTWSIKPDVSTTYSLRVYQDPDTISSGEATKYALQVGEF